MLKLKKFGFSFLVITFLLSACALDSESWIPFIICGISTFLLATIIYIYKMKEEEN